MASPEPFKLIYDEEAEAHLDFIPRKFHSLIAESVRDQLALEPLVETRNRKPLKQPIMTARWELRCGPQNRFRILYDVKEDEREVIILVVGVKERNRLLVRGEEVGP